MMINNFNDLDTSLDINAIKLQYTRPACKTFHDKTGDMVTKPHVTNISVFSMQRNGTQKARSATRIVTRISQKNVKESYLQKLKRRERNLHNFRRKSLLLTGVQKDLPPADVHILYPLQERAAHSMVSCQQGISACNVQSRGG